MIRNPPADDTPAPDAARSVAAPRSQALTFDLPCPRCGYNLRGLRENARCPECGSLVADAITGDWLVLAHPRWVARIEQGAMLSRLTALLALICAVLWLLHWAAPPPTSSLRREIPPAAMVVAYLLAMVSVWLLTWPNPAEHDSQSTRFSRMVTRACVLICSLTILALCAAWKLNVFHWGMLILCPIGLPGLVGTWTFEIHLRTLCRRLGRVDIDTRIAASRNTFTIAWLLCPVLLALLIPTHVMSAGGAIRLVFWIGGFVMGASGALLLTAPAALQDAIREQRRTIIGRPRLTSD